MNADVVHTTFVIRPHRGGWQCFEGPGVQPYFIGQDAQRDALSYAHSRTAHRVGEIRIVNGDGETEQAISYDGRMKWT